MFWTTSTSKATTFIHNIHVVSLASVLELNLKVKDKLAMENVL